MNLFTNSLVIIIILCLGCSPKVSNSTQKNITQSKVSNSSEENIAQLKVEYDITKGLIAYYPLDGNATNQVDDFYHGRETDTKPTKNRKGEESKALFFTGKSYVDLGIEFPSLAGQKQYSISCWFKSPNSGHILSRFDSKVEGEFIVGLAGGKAYFHRETDPWHAIGINTYDDNEWHHLVAVYNGRKNLVYIDGILEASKEIASCKSASNTPVIIGNGKVKGEIGFGPFTGSIDELRIYSRAVSKKEIMDLYKLE